MQIQNFSNVLKFHSTIKLLRCISSSATNNQLNVSTKVEIVPPQVVHDAERLIGYPTSFLNLRWLLNDEASNIAFHLKKLIGLNHPLLVSARELLLGKQNLSWGLIVLLVSKAGGLNSNFNQIDCDITAGILHNQRILSEVTEIIRTSNLIHKSIYLLDKSTFESNPSASDLLFGNKLALLAGDYLLSVAFRELAQMKNQYVNEIISVTLRDLSEAEFLGPRDVQNRPLPSLPKNIEDVVITDDFGNEHPQCDKFLGNARSEWILRHYLGGGSVLAKSCQCTLILGGHADKFSRNGFLFGRNLALAWQASLDAKRLKNGDKFSLISAPVLFHLQFDPTFYENYLVNLNNTDDFNYKAAREAILSGPGLQKTEAMQNEFSLLALKSLSDFPESAAKKALENIVEAM